MKPRHIPLLISSVVFMIAATYANQYHHEPMPKPPPKPKEVDCVKEFMHRIDSVIDHHYEGVNRIFDNGKDKPLGLYHRYQN